MVNAEELYQSILSRERVIERLRIELEAKDAMISKLEEKLGSEKQTLKT